MQEIVDHKNELIITLCQIIKACNLTADTGEIWKSIKDSNGIPLDPGSFLMGIGKAQGRQIRYLVPANRWDDCFFAKEPGQAPTFDDHKPEDILNRLNNLLSRI